MELNSTNKELASCLFYDFRFIEDISSECELPSNDEPGYSFISNNSVMTLYKMLWNYQEKIGTYLASRRYIHQGYILYHCRNSARSRFKYCHATLGDLKISS